MYKERTSRRYRSQIRMEMKTLLGPTNARDATSIGYVDIKLKSTNLTELTQKETRH